MSEAKKTLDSALSPTDFRRKTVKKEGSNAYSLKLIAYSGASAPMSEAKKTLDSALHFVPAERLMKRQKDKDFNGSNAYSLQLIA